MPALRINDRAYTIGPGHIRLGGGDGVDIGIGDDARLGEQAVIDVAGGQASIRRTGSGVVKVNGVPLGAEPMPLMHGDRVEIGGREVHYADDGKSGATEFVSHAELAALAPRRAGARATTSTGGRLVSLVDGKEYTIPARGVVLGRDASADIVIPSNEVSRRHAEIVPGDRGYVLRDQSTNGVFVNGDRVDGSRVLARADVVRIATEEFRFYADVIQAAIAPSAPDAARAQAPAAL
ncbi:MAG TPA: FHA domain-containing protein, partial [Gemmatimonadaceae bacterium]|nr:FHA domain-containing protein [Gemmatimonadaceae bacterium]